MRSVRASAVLCSQEWDSRYATAEGDLPVSRGIAERFGSMSSWEGVDLDRCAGVMLGLAAGDALGAGYEFGSPPTGEAVMKGGGLGSWDPGEWTDDTQLAICIAEETAGGGADPAEIGERFLDWYRSGPADVGNQTRSALARARDGGELSGVASSLFMANPRSSAGNGSLMRTAPVALAGLGNDSEIVRLATTVSALTHADPLAGEACALWCIGVDRAIRFGTLRGVWDGLEHLPAEHQGYWQARLEEVENGPPSRFDHNGFVVTAFQAALAAIWHTPVPEVEPCRHLQHALHAAVRIGNDTDTVAAITGSLLGARWGASAVPAEWRSILHGKPGIYGRPDYTSRDLVRLAVMSARRGSADGAGWPDAQDLTPYYERHWPGSPCVRELAEDPGVALANVFGVSVAKADVTVSLCRMGRGQLDERTHPLRVEMSLLDEVDPAKNPNLEFVFHDLAKSIVRWRDEGKTVLVHCVQAERRTPAVGAAYLAERKGLPGKVALETVCAQLPSARVNPAFAEALGNVWPGGRATATRAGLL